MLGDQIKKDAKIKISALKEDTVSEEEYVLCTGQIQKILSETELTMLSENVETELKKNTGYIMYLMSYEEVFRCSVYCRSVYDEEGKTVCQFEIVSPFEKVQRRKHHRVSCRSKIYFEKIALSEIEAQSYEIVCDAGEPEKDTEDSLVDISGGGIRFTSKQKVEKNEYLSICFFIVQNGKKIQMKTYGQVVYTGFFGKEEDCYDIRLKYVGLTELQKEQIIRFVFRLERENKMVK